MIKCPDSGRRRREVGGLSRAYDQVTSFGEETERVGGRGSLLHMQHMQERLGANLAYDMLKCQDSEREVRQWVGGGRSPAYAQVSGFGDGGTGREGGGSGLGNGEAKGGGVSGCLQDPGVGRDVVVSCVERARAWLQPVGHHCTQAATCVGKEGGITSHPPPFDHALFHKRLLQHWKERGGGKKGGLAAEGKEGKEGPWKVVGKGGGESSEGACAH
eukprot:360571-Chlamydomonas_euryale.AAC.1